MNNQLQDLAKKRFKLSLDELPEREHRVVQHFGERRHISRDTNQEFEKKLTIGQRLADKVAAFGGSWTFIVIFGAMIRTIALSILIPGLASFTSISQVRTGPASRPLAITHVTVIDAPGRSAMPNMTVVIAGERITQIGRSSEVPLPRRAQVVNGAPENLRRTDL